MDQDQKHTCKLCCKSFPSGRSLGGHMRSHVTTTTTTTNNNTNTNSNYSSSTSEDLEAQEKLQPSYRLRENPKKTWRISDSLAGFGHKQCRVCAREFQSWKALFGHMKSHSEKISRARAMEEQEEEEEEAGSHHSEVGAMVVGVPRGKRLSRRPRQQQQQQAPSSSSSAVSVSVSEFDKVDEEEDVALSLIMLSRDDKFTFGLKKLETDDDDDSDTEYFNSTTANYSDDSFNKRKKIMQEFVVVGGSSSSSKYECTTCNKNFDTYHALGGHRASHKRMKQHDKKMIGSNKYKCPICGKLFSSGQALGGHKRSHLAMAAAPSVVIPKEVEAIAELIDLNLPAAAPMDEGSSNADAYDAEFSFWGILD